MLLSEIPEGEMPKGYILLEYSPGVPADGYRTFDNVSEYSGNDGQERVCLANWRELASLPYCSYNCYPSPNVEEIVITAPHGCENGSDCIVEVLTVKISQILINNTSGNFSSGNFSSGNGTDSHSDGYVLECKWKNFLMLIMMSFISLLVN